MEVRGQGMTVLLDTTLLPDRDRAEAVVAAMRQAGVPAHVTHEDPDDVYARIEVFDLGGGETFSLSFDHTTLALPVDVIRAAVGRLEASPLFDVVRAHLLRVGRELQAIPPGPARAMLGNSMAELVRALITTTAQDTPAGRAALAETLRRRIADHLERHFADPDLTPAAIARAHNISLRQLYRVWAAEELSLSEWIVARRLEEARRALAAVPVGATTIGAVARRCGFADAAHFSRRFRSAYGLSPRQWQALHHP
jgi:AraC-like DNA-binding protein